MEELILDGVLPIFLDYQDITKINLENSHALKISKAGLDFYPFFVFNYKLFVERTDSNGKKYKIKDHGTKIIDATDSRLLSFEKIHDLKGFKNIVQNIFSKNDEEQFFKQIKETEINQIQNDLLEIQPIKKIKLKVSENYVFNKILNTISLRDAEKIVLNTIISEHIENITYKVKKRRSNKIIIKNLLITPRFSEIEITRKELIYVPKWIITFKCGQYYYKRQVLPSSKTIILDDLLYCHKHDSGYTRIWDRKKISHAVCELCGVILCIDHVFKINGSFYCSDHKDISLSENI